ncbi:hypothetical protein GSI_08457 [Ganoderma sinense ZZ0214-1]|uniref:Uncharacterized protein n=1 Tax=Ganoderma sinense ZZ0214-1 TaxID=1077348 RepID=A0A2G8S3R0_9APHY|nr:hypothetical protein GSI_08457 [Ganoderma sinense ZZ0214-1]
MKLIAPFVLLASLVSSSVGQDNFTVSVADHTQCATTVITWESGVGYAVEIQVSENNGHNALLAQYTIEPSCSSNASGRADASDEHAAVTARPGTSVKRGS